MNQVIHSWEVKVGDYTAIVHYAQEEGQTHYAAKVAAAKELCRSIMKQAGVKQDRLTFSKEVFNLRLGRLEVRRGRK